MGMQSNEIKKVSLTNDPSTSSSPRSIDTTPLLMAEEASSSGDLARPPFPTLKRFIWADEPSESFSSPRSAASSSVFAPWGLKIGYPPGLEPPSSEEAACAESSLEESMPLMQRILELSPGNVLKEALLGDWDNGLLDYPSDQETLGKKFLAGAT